MSIWPKSYYSMIFINISYLSYLLIYAVLIFDLYFIFLLTLNHVIMDIMECCIYFFS